MQDHIDNLKAKVNQLEADKRDRVVTKKIKKRAVPKAMQSLCTTSSSLCTHYHPDHPDAIRNKQTKYSPTVTSEVTKNDQSNEANKGISQPVVEISKKWATP